VVIGERLPGGTGTTVLLPPVDPALIGQANRALASRGVRWRFGGAGTPGPIGTAAVAGINGLGVTRRYRLEGAGGGGDTTDVPAARRRPGRRGRVRTGRARVGSDARRPGCGASGDRRGAAGRRAVRGRAVRRHAPHRREHSAPRARPARRRGGTRSRDPRPLMPLDFLIDRFDELPATRALAERLPSPGSRIALSGLPGSSPAVLVAALARRFPQRVFVVVT